MDVHLKKGIFFCLFVFFFKEKNLKSNSLDFFNKFKKVFGASGIVAGQFQALLWTEAPVTEVTKNS